MSNDASTHDRRESSSLGSLAIAAIAIVLSVVALIRSGPSRDPRFLSEYGGDSYLTLDGPGHNRIGVLLDDYRDGFIVRRLDRDRARRIEIAVGDEGVSIDLYRNESKVTRWSLTDEGERFKKWDNDPAPKRR